MASPKPSVPEAFRKTVGFLENEQVPFVVVGGLAASLQGEPRNTDDADFMITLSSKDVHRFAERAKAELVRALESTGRAAGRDRQPGWDG